MEEERKDSNVFGYILAAGIGAAIGAILTMVFLKDAPKHKEIIKEDSKEEEKPVPKKKIRRKRKKKKTA
jgi:predicted small secreted protein